MSCLHYWILLVTFLALAEACHSSLIITNSDDPRSTQNDKAMFTNIDVPTFKEKMEAPNTVILDVRTETEKVEGDIPGSILIDAMDPEFYTSIDELDKSKTYLVFCRSGSRSQQACMAMGDDGFKSLFNLEGGIKAWNAAAN